MDTVLVYAALVMAFVIGLIFGGVIVFFFRRMVINRQLRNAQRRAARMVAEAREEARGLLQENRSEAGRIKSTAEKELRDRRSELQRQENRLSQKTEAVDRRQ